MLGLKWIYICNIGSSCYICLRDYLLGASHVGFDSVDGLFSNNSLVIDLLINQFNPIISLSINQLTN